ncbi:MAG: hypothetical protein FJ213_11800 [Ignavibacteria bacterium]|nr:hypothetical protein [Ignavibacteria bacterium]
MITVFLFYVHIIFSFYIFTKRWQEESIVAAFVVIVLIGIIFSVGWTLSSFMYLFSLSRKVSENITNEIQSFNDSYYSGILFPDL